MAHRIIRILLIVFDVFLALSAIGGGIGLLTDLNAPPVEQLKGSPFSDYTIPGLALLVIVGGCALVATILLARRHKLGALFSLVSGISVVLFEIIEVLIIGSEPGVARNLQILYSGLGLLIVILTFGLLLTRSRAISGSSKSLQ